MASGHARLTPQHRRRPVRTHPLHGRCPLSALTPSRSRAIVLDSSLLDHWHRQDWWWRWPAPCSGISGGRGEHLLKLRQLCTFHMHSSWPTSWRVRALLCHALWKDACVILLGLLTFFGKGNICTLFPNHPHFQALHLFIFLFTFFVDFLFYFTSSSSIYNDPNRTWRRPHHTRRKATERVPVSFQCISSEQFLYIFHWTRSQNVSCIPDKSSHLASPFLFPHMWMLFCNFFHFCKCSKQSHENSPKNQHRSLCFIASSSFAVLSIFCFPY